MAPVPPTSGNESGDTNAQAWQQGISYLTLAIILVFVICRCTSFWGRIVTTTVRISHGKINMHFVF